MAISIVPFIQARRCRRKNTTLLLTSSAACVFAAALLAQRSFVSPQHGERKAGTPDDHEVSRGHILRWMPALALGLQAAPSFGDSGVTTAWGTTLEGDEDTIHTGGVQWEDVKIGTGRSPQIGELIAIDYRVKGLYKEKEFIIEDTKGQPRDFRFGVGQMLPGMDEGIKGMRLGGTRKLKIPGRLAFGAKAIAAGLRDNRPALPAFTPVDVTVKLVFIPGADDLPEDEDNQ